MPMLLVVLIACLSLFVLLVAGWVYYNNKQLPESITMEEFTKLCFPQYTNGQLKALGPVLLDLQMLINQDWDKITAGGNNIDDFLDSYITSLVLARKIPPSTLDRWKEQNNRSMQKLQNVVATLVPVSSNKETLH
jgi:hypothetical protein